MAKTNRTSINTGVDKAYAYIFNEETKTYDTTVIELGEIISFSISPAENSQKLYAK